MIIDVITDVAQDIDRQAGHPCTLHEQPCRGRHNSDRSSKSPGRYGNFTFVVSSEDAATRSIVSDIASAKDVAIFISSSPTHLDQAHPAGDLTVKDRETLGLVLQAGGTVTAAELAEQLGIENTTAGNRLIALNKKGYLQRLERAHPGGDQFLDARSVRLSRP